MSVGTENSSCQLILVFDGILGNFAIPCTCSVVYNQYSSPTICLCCNPVSWFMTIGKFPNVSNIASLPTLVNVSFTKFTC